MSKISKFFAIGVSLIFACILFMGAFFLYSLSPLENPSLSSFKTLPQEKKFDNSVRFSIRSGESLKTVAKELKNQQLIRNENVFYLAGRLASRKDFVLKSGTYRISPSMSVKQILSILSSGLQEYIKLSIPEGLTASKIASILDENGICSKEDFISCLENRDLLSKYKIPSINFEGYLFPDTYFFVPQMSAENVLSTMVDNFFAQIEKVPLENKDYEADGSLKFENSLKSKSPKEIYDTLILASIVEREYKDEKEAPLIASVFKNRLKANVGFYSCATIEYIITEIMKKPHPEKILYSDLSIDSPYNTYKWAGLTPTPISNPGLVALKACSNTPRTKYFYFTLTNPEKGTHTFTTNFDSHVNSKMSTSYLKK